MFFCPVFDWAEAILNGKTGSSFHSFDFLLLMGRGHVKREAEYMPKCRKVDREHVKRKRIIHAWMLKKQERDMYENYAKIDSLSLIGR